jgi:hypothetical protein
MILAELSPQFMAEHEPVVIVQTTLCGARRNKIVTRRGRQLMRPRGSPAQLLWRRPPPINIPAEVFAANHITPTSPADHTKLGAICRMGSVVALTGAGPVAPSAEKREEDQRAAG